ncbi:MAG TPA: sulfatase-like hydrolase/transferase [Edaphobacter sp.]|nr:sulfatase-like hydrolase/transferase [Edaphobacter sp.]
MTNRRDFLRGATAAVCAASLPLRATKQTARPNILLLITDQQSADTASYRIGTRYIHTPNIDSLAASGTSFTRAYCANPLCVPSRASMFTGRYPTETGVMDNSDLYNVRLDTRKFHCMGKIFQRAGYKSAYFGKWHLPWRVDDTGAHGFTTMATTVNDDTATAFSASEFLQSKPDAPFLLVASFLNPHNICEWARGQQLPLGSIGQPPRLDRCPPLRANHLPQKNEPDIISLMRRSYQSSPTFPVGNFSEKQWREYLWAYYRLIEKADAQIGVALKALRDSGLDRNTVIVFTADHGDCQGAHGWNQKTVFYDEASRVPLIISSKSRASGTSTQLVNTGIDLIPTLCDLAGINTPPELPGISVKSANVHSRQYIVASNKMVQGAPVDGRKPVTSGRMVRSQRYKYCVYDKGDHRESLVDLEKDPGEMTNLAGEQRFSKELDQHRAMLKEWCDKTHDSFPIAG